MRSVKTFPEISIRVNSLSITRKKICQIALQKSDSLQGAHCFLFRRDMFIWADETGSDNRNCIRKYGYALRGQTPVCQRILSRGKRINAVSAISSSGILATEITTGTINGDFFFDYL